MTQESLARRINRQKSLISEYENDVKTPTIDNLKEIAYALDVNITYLMGEGENVFLSNVEREWMNLCFEIQDEKKIKEMILIVQSVISYNK